jgi:hypothetical protein
MPATVTSGAAISRMPSAEVAPTRIFCITLSWRMASGSSVVML